MPCDKRLLLGLTIMMMLLGLPACSNSDRSNGGVAQINESLVLETRAKPAMRPEIAAPSRSKVDLSKKNTDTSELTDEEIATRFTTCVQDHGFNVPDPELNADGTLNWESLKISFGQIETDWDKGRASKVLDDCMSLLEGITIAKDESPEDEIELQDNLLKFAQCLRNKGIDVPDPDFSDDPRAGMKTMLANLKGSDSKVNRSIAQCNELIFGGRESGKK